ncbi:MAG: hypothetical protein D6805_03300 [Planctomycetota bacterium]|nr:MAG: hypothetical protein D6805_03300 [Planctomycetota bacterium]
MRTKSVLFLLIFSLTSSLLWAKPSRQYRKFKLKNGLKVVLVSDARLRISSASMSVKIGSLADPPQRMGLAHFLEHMLFLATKKYPRLNSYGEFLKARGGYSNAYTATDHTNYHFQVNHEGLPEALDRFAQFFISPLLDYKYAKREVAAVHSEHQKNIPNDTWRLMQLQRSLLKKGHPATKFHTGCNRTLAGTKEEELRAFFQAYYTAPNMALCVMSSRSLEELEHLVRRIFSPLPSRPPKPFHVSADLLDPVEGYRFIRVLPVKRIRQLHLYFPVQLPADDYLTKTSRLFGMTIGDEGKGSLLSLLKRLGLASSLSAGASRDSRFYGGLRITVGLTQKGLKEYNTVLRLCLAYLEMLKNSPFPLHIWKEMKTLAEISHRYSPPPEGTEAAIGIANFANEYGLKYVEKWDHLFLRPDPRSYRHILQQLQIERALIFLVAKTFPDLPRDKKERWKEEPWYGTQYADEVVKGKDYLALKHLPKVPQLHLPLPNPFLPRRFDLIVERPILILQQKGIRLWYAPDYEFKRPKLALALQMISPTAYASARDFALLRLYVALLLDSLNEYAYPAQMAGLSYRLQANRKGVFLQLSGYSDSVVRFFTMLVKFLKKKEFHPQDFARIKERLVQLLENAPYQQAYLVSRESARKFFYKTYYLPEEILQALRSCERKDVQDFANRFFQKLHIQAIGVGNITAPHLKSLIVSCFNSLKATPLSAKELPVFSRTVLPEGKDLIYRQNLLTNNSCLRIDYQVGKADLKTQVAAELFARAIRSPFYTQMRTRQMLGYIVWSGTYFAKPFQYQVFLIQSGTHSADDLFQRADAFLAALPKLFAKMPPKMFEAIRRGYREDLRKPFHSVAEKAFWWYNVAFERGEDFELIQKKLQILQNITQDEVASLLSKTLAPKTRRRIVFLHNAKQFATKGIDGKQEMEKLCQERRFSP